MRFLRSTPSLLLLLALLMAMLGCGPAAQAASARAEGDLWGEATAFGARRTFVPFDARASLFRTDLSALNFVDTAIGFRRVIAVDLINDSGTLLTVDVQTTTPRINIASSSVNIAANSRVTLLVEFAPVAEEQVSGILALTPRASAQPPVYLPIAGRGVNYPILEFTAPPPGTLQVRPGQTLQLPLAVYNAGLGDTSVTATSVNGDTTLEPPLFGLPPATTRTLALNYTAPAATPDETSVAVALSFYSDDPRFGGVNFVQVPVRVRFPKADLQGALLTSSTVYELNEVAPIGLRLANAGPDEATSAVAQLDLVDLDLISSLTISVSAGSPVPPARLLSLSSRSLQLEVPRLPAGRAVELQGLARVVGSPDAALSATVSSLNPFLIERVPANNSTRVVLRTLQPDTSISVERLAPERGAFDIEKSQKFESRVRVRNAGPAVAYRVQLIESVQIESAAPGAGPLELLSTTVLPTTDAGVLAAPGISSLAPGQAVEVRRLYRAARSGTATVSEFGTSLQPQPDANGSTSSLRVRVLDPAAPVDLRVSLELDRAQAERLATFTSTMVIANQSITSAVGVLASQGYTQAVAEYVRPAAPLPEGATLQTVAATSTQPAQVAVALNRPLPAGAATTISLQWLAVRAPAEFATIATALAGTGEVAPGDNSASRRLGVLPAPQDLYADLSCSVVQPLPAAPLIDTVGEARFELRNFGPAETSSVEVLVAVEPAFNAVLAQIEVLSGPSPEGIEQLTSSSAVVRYATLRAPSDPAYSTPTLRAQVVFLEPGEAVLSAEVSALAGLDPVSANNRAETRAQIENCPPGIDGSVAYTVAPTAKCAARGCAVRATATVGNPGTLALPKGTLRLYVSADAVLQESGDQLVRAVKVKAVKLGKARRLRLSAKVPGAGAASLSGQWLLAVLAPAPGETCPLRNNTAAAQLP